MTAVSCDSELEVYHMQHLGSQSLGGLQAGVGVHTNAEESPKGVSFARLEAESPGG